MATFELEVNGRKFDIEAPDAAAAAAAAKQYAAQTAKTPPDSPQASATGPGIPAPAQASTPLPDVPEQYRGGKVQMQKIDGGIKGELEKNNWADRQIAGLGSAAALAGQGVRQLFGGKVEDREIQDWRGVSDAGTVGNIAGNVAMTILPVGAAEKAIRGGLTAARAAKIAAGSTGAARGLAAAKAAVTPVLAAGENILLSPTKSDESTLKEAGKAGLGATVAELGLRGAGRVLGPGLVKASELGKELMAQGRTPTVGQAGRGAMGSIAGFGEDALNALGVKGPRERIGLEAMREVSEDAFSGYAHTGKNLSRKSEFFKETTDALDAGYKALFDNKTLAPPTTWFRHATNTGIKAMPHATDEVQGILTRNTAEIFERLKSDKSGQGLSIALQEFRDLADSAAKDISGKGTDLTAGYKRMHDSLLKRAEVEGALTKNEVAQLEKLREAWSKKALLQTAARKPLVAGQTGTSGQRLTGVDNLIDASRQTAPDAQFLNEKEHWAKILAPIEEAQLLHKNTGSAGRQAAYRAAGPLLGTGALAATAGAGWGALPLIASLGLGGVGMSKTGSKVLLGNTDAQRKMAEIIKKTMIPRVGTISAAVTPDD